MSNENANSAAVRALPAASSHAQSPRAAFSGVPYDEIPFKERQRLDARRMEVFGFGGWLASTLFYGASATCS